MSIIEVKDLKYRYPDTTATCWTASAFRSRRVTIGLIGRNTAGKSTLCYALSGLVPHFFSKGLRRIGDDSRFDVRTTDVSEVVLQRMDWVFETRFPRSPARVLQYMKKSHSGG